MPAPVKEEKSEMPAKHVERNPHQRDKVTFRRSAELVEVQDARNHPQRGNLF